jgi:hypothetical protein
LKAAASAAVKPLAPQTRVTCPMPDASTGAARSWSKPSAFASWKTHALPSCATFSSSVIRASRSATRSSTEQVESR